MCLVTFSWISTSAQNKIKWHKKTSQISWAYIEPTNACNLACDWCYASSGITKGKNKHISTQKMTFILELLIDAGIKQVTFGGGEPLLYPDLTKWISKLTKEGIIVHLNSNAVLLTEDLAFKLAECGLEQIQTNIESIDPETHDKVRGCKGAHKKVLDAIDYALEAGIVVTSQIVITKKNKDFVPTLMSFLRDLGVQRCRVWDMTPSGNALKQLELIPDNYSLYLNHVIQEAYKLGAKSVISYEPLFPLEVKPPIKVTHIPCPASFGMLITIDVDGDIIYCCTKRTKLYNIYDIKDGQTLISRHLKAICDFNDEYPLPTKCGTCRYKSNCTGGCISRRKLIKDVDYQCLQ